MCTVQQEQRLQLGALENPTHSSPAPNSFSVSYVQSCLKWTSYGAMKGGGPL